MLGELSNLAMFLEYSPYVSRPVPAIAWAPPLPRIKAMLTAGKRLAAAATG